jgi:glycosyltransferase involved in cell wall biosynthesis
MYINNENIKISLLMSVYNGEKYLTESINSVLNQSFQEYEFIIVNDGSTDSSAEIIDEYQKKDKRIKVIHKKNTGLANSLNIGLKESCAEFIARIDDDDICESDRLEKQYAYIQNNPSIILLGSNAKFIDINGNLSGFLKYPSSHKKILKNLSTIPFTFPHSSVLYSRKIALEIGGYREQITHAEDLDMWLRLSNKGDLACLPDSLVSIRIHPDQVSYYNNGQQVDAYLAMVSYWYDKLYEESIFNLEFLSYEQVRSLIIIFLKSNNHLVYQRRLSKFKENYASRHDSRIYLLARFCIIDIKVLLWALKRKFLYVNDALRIAKIVHKKNV